MLADKKILVVEDSPTIKLLLKMILEREGANIAEAGSEWGMLTKIDEYGKVADLIIIDLFLNFENGMDLIKNLKDNPKYKDIPIIIVTENVDIDTIMQAKGLGIKNYLKKPFKKADLIDRINKIFKPLDNETTLAES